MEINSSRLFCGALRYGYEYELLMSFPLPTLIIIFYGRDILGKMTMMMITTPTTVELYG